MGKMSEKVLQKSKTLEELRFALCKAEQSLRYGQEQFLKGYKRGKSDRMSGINLRGDLQDHDEYWIEGYEIGFEEVK
jgi:hypothetical protein